MWTVSQIRRFIRKLGFKRVDQLLFHSDFSHVPEISPRLQNLVVQKVRKPEKVGIPQLDKKLSASNCCYYVCIGNHLAHQNWVFFKSHLLNQFGLPKLPVLGDGFTLEQFRGQGIQPFVLTKMLRDLASQGYKGAYTLVSPSNASSIRGVEKAGFVLKMRLKGSRLLGIYYRKTII